MCLLCVSCLVSCVVSRTHKSLSSHLACYSKFSRSHTTPKFASHPHTLVGYSSHSLVYVYVLRAVDSLTDSTMEATQASTNSNRCSTAGDRRPSSCHRSSCYS